MQRVLDNARDGQERPEEMPDWARRQVIAGDGKCLFWALSAVDGAVRQAAADEGTGRGPQSRGWQGKSCRTQECGRGGSTWTKCARGRYGDEHVKLGGGPKARDAE